MENRVRLGVRAYAPTAAEDTSIAFGLCKRFAIRKIIRQYPFVMAGATSMAHRRSVGGI